MNLEQLERGKRIVVEIEKCKQNIEAASYTQREDVYVIETHLSISGIKQGIRVPEGLFRIVGKLIMSEHQRRLIELEEEFESL